MITHEILKSRLQYDANTGIFTHISGKLKGKNIGEKITKDWYLGTKINKKYYLLHRLAWLYVFGEMPSSQIDHIDGNKSNNKISNLRLATSSENSQNVGVKSSNKSGRIGVYWAKHAKKWHSQIKHNNKKYHLGYFDTIDEAYNAYLTARGTFFTFSPMHR